MVTGATGAGTELFAKRAQVLSEVAPTAKRLALLSDLTQANDVAAAKFVGVGADQAGLELRVLDIHASADIGPAFDDARAWGADALFIFPRRGPHSQGREAGRDGHRATDDVRVRHRSANRPRAGPHDPAVRSEPSDESDPVRHGTAANERAIRD